MYRNDKCNAKVQKRGAKRKFGREMQHFRSSISCIDIALDNITHVQVNLAIAKVELESACLMNDFTSERLEQLTEMHAKIKNLVSDLKDIEAELYSASQLGKGITNDDNESN